MRAVGEHGAAGAAAVRAAVGAEHNRAQHSTAVAASHADNSGKRLNKRLQVNPHTSQLGWEAPSESCL